MTACTIRPYRADDAPRLFEAARESIAEVFQWLAWCHPRYSLEEAAAWVSACDEKARQGLEYNFAIVDAQGRFLGGCGINQINPLHRFANLGYWVRSSETGRGVAVEAARQAARFAMLNTDLVRLEILCPVGNERSRRVAEKAGAVREGILADRLMVHGRARDAILHSIVRSRWAEPDGKTYA